MQISTSVVWCSDVVVNIIFFFIIILPIVATVCFDLLDLSLHLTRQVCLFEEFYSQKIKHHELSHDCRLLKMLETF